MFHHPDKVVLWITFKIIFIVLSASMLSFELLLRSNALPSCEIDYCIGEIDEIH